MNKIDPYTIKSEHVEIIADRIYWNDIIEEYYTYLGHETNL